MPDAPKPPVEIFLSYAEQDEEWCVKLEKHLIILQREGLITIWNKRCIIAGKDSTEELDQHLSTASIILLLLSVHFIASDYCYGIETQRAMQRHEAGEAKVIPIVLHPMDSWQNTPFGRLTPLPSNGKPVTEFSDSHTAFTDIVKGIRTVLTAPQKIHPTPPPLPLPPPRPLVNVSRRNLLTLAGSFALGAGVGALGYRIVTSLKALREIRIIFIQSTLASSVDPDQLKNALEETSGLPVTALELHPKTYADCVTRFGTGEFNLLWDGAYAYVRAAAQYGAQPLLQLKNQTKEDPSHYFSYILTKKSSGIRTIADLKERSLTLVDKYSTSGYLYPLYELSKYNLNEKNVQTLYVEEHAQSLEAVISGSTDAGAVSDEYYKDADGNFKANTYKYLLKKYNIKDEDILSLSRSDPIPMGPLVAHPDLLEDDVRKLQNAFLLLDDPTLLRSLAISGFGSVTDVTYNPIREIAHALNIDLQ